MKFTGLIVIIAFGVLGLLSAATSTAEPGTPGCSNPCVISPDGVDGEITKGTLNANYSPQAPPKSYSGPFHGSHGVLDDNQAQDMPIYDNTAHSTWPGDRERN